MHWTHVLTALVALHCARTPALIRRPAAAEGAIRVLVFPRSPHMPPVHPAEDRDDRPEAPDMVACLRAMSYTCLQRKTAVYLDALNRLDRIRLLGDFITAVRTRPVDSKTPTISENLLEARGLNNVFSLSVLVNWVVQNMVRDHALRISFPRIAGLGEPYRDPAAAAAATAARPGIDGPDGE